MCGVTEYDELPVRHNEDLLNLRLSGEVRPHPQRLRAFRPGALTLSFTAPLASVSRQFCGLLTDVIDVVVVLEPSCAVDQSPSYTPADHSGHKKIAHPRGRSR